MRNFKKLSSLILILCTATTVFASCNDKENTDYSSTSNEEKIIITEFITEKETVKVNVTDNNGEVSVSVSEKIVTVPVTKIITAEKSSASETGKTIKMQKNNESKANTLSPDSVQSSAQKTRNAEATTTVTQIKTTSATTKKAVVDDKINEQSIGISLLTKSESVLIGNEATIFIQGTPGKTYSIEFYETPSSAANSDSLKDKKADENGIVSWTFEIKNNCNPGKRKLVIKEKSSTNYLETSITVK